MAFAILCREDSMSELRAGLVGQTSITVTAEVTARHLGSGAVAVFATPEMVRLMEKAAMLAVAGQLAPREQTVGTMVNVRHLAATPLGATIVATAELVGVEGRRLFFNVKASDGKDLIGEGTHERAIIDVDRFEARLAAKRAEMALPADPER
jgi:fluoroacetyl-CoA thioesterase